MELAFEGRSVVVTGGASGIGDAIVRRVVAQGGRCLIADIQDRPGRELAEELGDACSYAHLDVTDEEQFARVIDGWVSTTGRIDHLFSNAGATGALGPIQDTPLGAWRSTIDLLLTSTFLGIKTVTPYMRSQGSGSIVCTASVASLRGGLGPHVYTAAKHGVWGLVQSVAAEFAGYGLRINCVAPGGVVSALTAAIVSGDPTDLDGAYATLGASSRSGRPTTATDVAASATFLASDLAGRVNGACLAIDGGQDLNSAAALRYFESAAGR